MSIWQRQYDSPPMEALLDELQGEHREGMNTLRSWLGEHLRGVKPTLEYFEAAWHWCERYELKESDTGDLVSVFLIPDPESPRVAVCCRRRFFDRLTVSEWPKAVHAGLSEGVCVGHLAWCEWPLQSTDTPEQLIELISHMHSD